MAKSEEGCDTNLVILKILSRRRARRTLMPKEVPGLKNPHSTSKMLPTITYRDVYLLYITSITVTERLKRGLMPHNLRTQALGFWDKQIYREGDRVLTLQSKQLKEEWK